MTTTQDAWIICPVCEGDGTTVNPNVDAHGLTADDFLDDPDFRDDYHSGAFNMPCAACHGSGKTRLSHIEELEEAADARRLAARENGDYEGYCMADDWRYGV